MSRKTGRSSPDIRIGTAGWNVPKQYADEFEAAKFEGGGSHLQRYAARFNCVEINSSFYRPHQPKTYARWAASVPDGFLFAVKVPREITHTLKLAAAEDAFAAFLEQARHLEDRLGPLLVQLPPRLAYDAKIVRAFFKMVRAHFPGDVVCEPRHATWFTDDVDNVLAHFKVARVAADPALSPRAAVSGGWGGLTYDRLHGSPKMYYSAYTDAYLKDAAVRMRSKAPAHGAWCIFDNTAMFEATGNALALQQLLLSHEEHSR